MTSTKNVQNTHINESIRNIHGSLLDIISVINQPQRDEELMKEAGITLDRALFPLLVGINTFGPISVVDLADRAGRDHTTVSRQLAKLESLGLVERVETLKDRRVKKAAITAKGKSMTDLLDRARERMGQALFNTWEKDEIDMLVQLMRKFADGLKNKPPANSQT